MGASGAIFGTHAAVLVDLVWHWKLFERPKRMLFALIFEIIVGFGLGAYLINLALITIRADRYLTWT